MSIAIKVENLSKAYQLGEIGTGTLSNDLKRWAYKIQGKEDPFLKIGETNDRTIKGESDIVWSLKDINFEIGQGDAVGIIGRNGAGKSTLLKILSRVTSPTTGSVKVKGRVASLLEVGTGFHPELSGRENIFLNGAILGMRKAEIKKHFDAIVDFAGVERYIDTPVKRYSSGMYVRLAFAVAAHLESEILVVDEVLAVGDAEFQKKCLGKMGDLSKGEGRTVLFVSHNMIAVRDLCTKTIILEKGQLTQEGETNKVINNYLSQSFTNVAFRIWEIINAPGTKEVKLIKAQMIPQLTKLSDSITIMTPLVFEFEFVNFIDDFAVTLGMELLTLSGIDIFTTGPTDVVKLKKGTYKTTCTIPAELLNDGVYTIAIQFGKDGKEMLYRETEVLIFEINDTVRPSGYTGKWPGLIRPRLNWTMEAKNEKLINT